MQNDVANMFRMRVHHAAPLMLRKDLNLKLILLVRDPRAVR